MRFQGDASELALWAEILESPALGLAVYVSPSGGRFQNLGFDGKRLSWVHVPLHSDVQPKL